MWVMVMAMRLVGNEEGKGKDSKGNCDGNVRVVGEEEGKDCKAIALAIRLVGEWTATVAKRLMATAMRVVGKQW